MCIYHTKIEEGHFPQRERAWTSYFKRQKRSTTMSSLLGSHCSKIMIVLYASLFPCVCRFVQHQPRPRLHYGSNIMASLQGSPWSAIVIATCASLSTHVRAALAGLSTHINVKNCPTPARPRLHYGSAKLSLDSCLPPCIQQWLWTEITQCWFILTLAQSSSCVEASLEFATRTTSKHQRITWPGL